MSTLHVKVGQAERSCCGGLSGWGPPPDAQWTSRGAPEPGPSVSVLISLSSGMPNHSASIQVRPGPAAARRVPPSVPTWEALPRGLTGATTIHAQHPALCSGSWSPCSHLDTCLFCPFS